MIRWFRLCLKISLKAHLPWPLVYSSTFGRVLAIHDCREMVFEIFFPSTGLKFLSNTSSPLDTVPFLKGFFVDITQDQNWPRGPKVCRDGHRCTFSKFVKMCKE